METVLSHELMHYLEDYFVREDVELMVVGKPLQADGTPSESMKPLQFFIQAFRKRFPTMRVAWMDERYTSSMASAAMLEGGVKKKGRQDKAAVDKISASLILQSWMERRNNLSG